MQTATGRMCATCIGRLPRLAASLQQHRTSPSAASLRSSCYVLSWTPHMHTGKQLPTHIGEHDASGSLQWGTCHMHGGITRRLLQAPPFKKDHVSRCRCSQVAPAIPHGGDYSSCSAR